MTFLATFSGEYGDVMRHIPLSDSSVCRAASGRSELHKFKQPGKKSKIASAKEVRNAGSKCLQNAV